MILKTRKCKVCSEVFQKKTPLHSICSGACATKHLIAQNEKRKAKELKESRRETKAKLEKLKSITDYANEAQKVFNQFIRARDEKLPCISCGTTKPVQYCAGHYRTRGAASHLRFNEDNVHKQCNKYCNLENSGNIVNYRTGLIAKIGVDRVEAIENNNATHKWTREELLSIKEIYKVKLKQLKDAI